MLPHHGVASGDRVACVCHMDMKRSMCACVCVQVSRIVGNVRA